MLSCYYNFSKDVEYFLLNNNSFIHKFKDYMNWYTLDYKIKEGKKREY